MNMGTWIRKWAEYLPDKTAIIFEGNKYTYKDLNERANSLANAFINLGIVKGDRVAAILYNCNEFMEIYFALAKIGAIFVPLNYRLAGPEIEYMLNHCRAKALVFHPEVKEIIDSIRPSVPIEAGNYIYAGETTPSWTRNYRDLLSYSTGEPETVEEVTLEDPQIIMYTSGTTGAPKGALLSHRKTFYNTLNAQVFADLNSQDVMLVVVPLFHSGGLNVTALPALYYGATAVILRRFDAQKVLQAIQEQKVTKAVLIATMLNFILQRDDLKEYDLSSLKACMTGGERVPVSLLEELRRQGIPVRQIFGQTETSILLWLPEPDAIRKIAATGRPVMYGEVKVVNKSGHEVAPGEVGEIIVRGPLQMMGYWDNPEETEKVFRGGWLHTGDLARVDEEGFVYIVDREKDMYISGGENVYPAEIEKVLAKNPKILEAAVIGVPDKKWGEAGKVFVALKNGEKMGIEELVDFCKDKIAKYKTPKYVEFVKELPKTASGKIKKTVLRKALNQN